MINEVYAVQQNAIALNHSFQDLINALDYALSNNEIEYDEYLSLKQNITNTEQQIQSCLLSISDSQGYKKVLQEAYDFEGFDDFKKQREGE